MILTSVACPRCGDLLEAAIGPDDNTGAIGTDLSCRECDYREQPRYRWSRADIRKAIAERNRQCGHFDEGTEIPLHIDTSPFPEEDWS